MEAYTRPRQHPGWRSWKCTGCGKVWQVPADVPSPALRCDCGNRIYTPV